MTWPDIVNGTFEWFAAMFLLLNLRRLIQDKCVKGVSIVPVIFFMLWGVWNLYYYPYLGQWVSFIGGIAVVLVNVTWVGLALWYKYKETEDAEVHTQ